MSKKDAGPAFPSTNEVQVGDFSTHGHPGMTLRDYFAAKAMQALISVYAQDKDVFSDDIAGLAYNQADEMLERREK